MTCEHEPGDFRYILDNDMYIHCIHCGYPVYIGSMIPVGEE